MKRAYYSSKISDFIRDNNDSILGELTRHHSFALEELQRNSWIYQIELLKKQLAEFENAYILFEYSIPRMGKRVDIVVLYNNIVYVIEFKVGEKKYSNYAIEQVIDYSFDLKNFHEKSHKAIIIPVLVSTEAEHKDNIIEFDKDNVYKTVFCNRDNIKNNIKEIDSSISHEQRSKIDFLDWENSIYKPTPTIVQAAQALYKGHNVEDISRSDSGKINLGRTSEAIDVIITNSKIENKKSICFITGVPGAGKTLAGLNIANQRHNVDEGEHAVFLSGNGPLVIVLQEALARDEVFEKKRKGEKANKKESHSKTSAFIQNIHHFRDDALRNEEAPIEKVAVFDEAQRAWTLEQTKSFMIRKKGVQDFNMSEPEFLIDVMNRHKGYAVIICLIGGGQEINIGEAGLPEWFRAINRRFPEWDVHVSDKLTDYEYTNGESIYEYINERKLFIDEDLHLSVSVRSFRSEKQSDFVKKILDNESEKAKRIYQELKQDYPIVITRNIDTAKDWLKANARGTESLGLVASSGAYRLRPHGINIKSTIDPKTWFLNPNNDIRAAGFLEEAATEFDIQGLELDWVCVAWDANMRRVEGEWIYKNFRGTKWQSIKDERRLLYLKNSYRVLLTRARQGMVLFIPEGDDNDQTRKKEYYNGVYDYFKEIGINAI